MVQWPVVSTPNSFVNCLQGTFLCCFGCPCLGLYWSRRHILFHVDNEAVVHTLNSWTSPDPNIMQLFRNLLKVAACLSFTLAAVHVPGKNTGLAVALSHFTELAGISFSSSICQEVSTPHLSTSNSSALHSDLEARCLSFMYKGLAASPHHSYSCAQEKFINFCLMIGHLSPLGSPSPAKEWTSFLFATYLADSLQHSSIKVNLSAVWSLHVNQGFPTQKNCFGLQRVVRRIKHSQGTILPSKPHLPISSNILHIIHSALDFNSFDDIMLWAACLLAYFGFLRSAEFTISSLSAFNPSVHLSPQFILCSCLH